MPLNLTATQNTLTELYEITYSNGVKSYFTRYRTSVVWGGNTYQPIPIKRTAISYHSDLQSDNVTITMGIVGVTVGAQSLTVPQIIARDWWKNAIVKIYRIDPLVRDEVKTLFHGIADGAPAYDAGTLSVECGNILNQLQRKFPRIIYSEQCNHTLFSQSPHPEQYTLCELSKAAWGESGTVQAGSTAESILAAVLAYSNKAAGWWVKGELLFTSGTLNGMSRTIELHGDGSAAPIVPFPAAPAAGDTFTVYPGCDLSGRTCDEKFANYPNFFGFETVPPPEAIAYA